MQHKILVTTAIILVLAIGGHAVQESSMSKETIPGWVLSVELRLRSLRAENEALREEIASLRALEPYLTVEQAEINGLAGPHIIFTGANLHIRSGSGSTDDGIGNGGTLTGLGNLIIGYNEEHEETHYRNGAHNIVVGPYHDYGFQSYGGIVTGWDNEIWGQSASIIGGCFNEAIGDRSAIVGGCINITTGRGSAIIGGAENETVGGASTITGGRENETVEIYSSISGGSMNQTLGFYSTVSGGHLRTVYGQYDWAGGGIFQDD